MHPNDLSEEQDFIAFAKALRQAEQAAEQQGKQFWVCPTAGGYTVRDCEPERSELREGTKAVPVSPSEWLHSA